MRSNWSRRGLLGGLSSTCLVGLAGCTDSSESSRGATDVFIHNEGDLTRTVDVTVTQRGSESPRIDTQLEIRSHQQEKINNKVIMDSDYDVEVSVTDTARESPYSESQEWNDAGQPLHIILNDQIVFAVQIG
jgi:hypothetical protein